MTALQEFPLHETGTLKYPQSAVHVDLVGSLLLGGTGCFPGAARVETRAGEERVAAVPGRVEEGGQGAGEDDEAQTAVIGETSFLPAPVWRQEALQRCSAVRF